MYTHQTNVITAGKTLLESGKALILIHGRGATGASILSLQHNLDVKDFSLFAPQATSNSWYPYSFLAPQEQNQPALNSALNQIDLLVQNIKGQGITSQNIYLLGFSQGACLTAEYATRNSQKFGGLLLFTGGLIGEHLNTANYTGDFNGTPVLLTTGDPDAHVPVSRVEETAHQMSKMGAVITKKIYKNRPHTILPEELNLANKILNLEA